MPMMNGSRVRHRIAELDQDGLRWLAAQTGIPEGTLKNATRDCEPQPLRLRRVYRVADALGLQFSEVVAGGDGTGDGTPDRPPDQPTQPTGPPRRKDKKKAPKRVSGVAA